MFAVSMNGDTPLAIVILEQQRTIHAGPEAPLICHGCTAHKSDRLPPSVKTSLYVVAIGRSNDIEEVRLNRSISIFFIISKSPSWPSPMAKRHGLNPVTVRTGRQIATTQLNSYRDCWRPAQSPSGLRC